jgi:hypothetical protein
MDVNAEGGRLDEVMEGVHRMPSNSWRRRLSTQDIEIGRNYGRGVDEAKAIAEDTYIYG